MTQPLVLWPRSPAVSPLNPGAECVCIELLTVPSDRLEEAQGAGSGMVAPSGSQWRMEYSRPAESPALTAEAMRALTVAEKVLMRGRITLLSAELEQSLKANPPSHANKSTIDPDLAYELDPRSPAERTLLRELAGAMGEGWYRWVFPQFDLSAATLDAPSGTLVGRADFLLTHPVLKRPLVIEVDGPQHDDTAADGLRDQALKRAGYGVFRISTPDVTGNRSPDLARLLELLRSHREQRTTRNGIDSKFRHAGQIQAALVHALFTGLFPLDTLAPQKISCDLIESREFTLQEFQDVLDDLVALLQRCGAMYGTPMVPHGLQASQTGGFRLVFRAGGSPIPPGEVRLYECVFPFRLAMPTRSCSAGLPVAYDKEALDWFLQRIFRKPSLFPEQYAAIARALSGQDAVVLLPTGAGKSIAFQLTGFVLPGRALVVAPINSLIRDQALVLLGHGVDRVLPMTGGEFGTRALKDAGYELLRQGDALFTYVAPERFQIQAFRDALRGLILNHPVSLVAIDEAHCVSEWGHNFRPAYLRIGRASREVCRDGDWTPPLMALTGTASRMVLRDLQRELEITDYEALITPETFDRKEIDFAVISSDSQEKEARLIAALTQWLPNQFGRQPSDFHAAHGSHSYCGLIFCSFVGGQFGIMAVQRALTLRGLPTEVYAGKAPKNWVGDWDAHKREVEIAFKRNDVLRIACTNAFGMGIDKPNVRYTVHYGMPPSIESFYQEAGRAGRNRQRALCLLLFSEFDPTRNGWLLSPGNEIDQVSIGHKKVSYAEADDITRALWFQTESFKGLSADRESVREVQKAIGPLGSRRKVQVAYRTEDGRTQCEKVVHRLTVLGVVEDYIIDYAARAMHLTISGSPPESLLERYVAYVQGYQTARANKERQQARAILGTGVSYDDFVAALLDLYLQFVYDVIEKGRRRALNEMLEAARRGVTAPDALRARILAYLEATQFSESLEAILNGERAGMGLVFDAIAGVQSPREAAELRGQVGRYLATYPDQPALLFLRALTECLCLDGDDETARSNFAAWLSNGTSRYDLQPQELIDAAVLALARIPRRHRAVADWLEAECLTQWPTRDIARSLVSGAGLQRLRYAPWNLLQASLRGAEHILQPVS